MMTNTVQMPKQHFPPLALRPQKKVAASQMRKLWIVLWPRPETDTAMTVRRTWVQEPSHEREDKWACWVLPLSTKAAHSWKTKYTISQVLNIHFLASVPTHGSRATHTSELHNNSCTQWLRNSLQNYILLHICKRVILADTPPPTYIWNRACVKHNANSLFCKWNGHWAL